MSAELQKLVGEFSSADDYDLEWAAGRLSSLLSSFDFSISNDAFDIQTGAGVGPCAILASEFASALGVPHARLGTSGTSINNIALPTAMRALLGRAPRVLCDRQSHGSVIGGHLIARSDVTWATRRYDPTLNLELPLLAADVEAALDANPAVLFDMVHMTMPTYDGICLTHTQLQDLRDLCTKRGLRLVIDAAWGVLHGMISELPVSVASYADCATFSPHKKGMGLSQCSAVTFTCPSLLAAYDRVMELGFATTSPLFMMLQPLEDTLASLKTDEGREQGSALIAAASTLRHDIATLDGCSVLSLTDLPSDYCIDPLHTLVGTVGTGISGYDIAMQLAERFAIDVEKATHSSILILVGTNQIGNTNEIVAALRDIVDAVPAPKNPVHVPTPPPTTIQSRYSLNDAFEQPIERLGLGEAVGRVSGQMVAAYPPGSPVLLPGEIITGEALEFLLDSEAAGSRIKGVNGRLSEVGLDVMPNPEKPKPIKRNEDLAKARAVNRANIEALGVDPFPARAFSPREKVIDLPQLFLIDQSEDLANRPTRRIAGRLISIRRVGKATFADIWQEHATVQLYCSKSSITDKDWAVLQYLDIGDFVGIEGPLFETKKGELTINVATIQVLGKPSHAVDIGKVDSSGIRRGEMSDQGALLREKRHVGFLTNPVLAQNLKGYDTIRQVFRSVLQQQDFTEVTTSILGRFYGGAEASPFTTHCNALGRELFLRISPEPDLKRLQAAGMENIYEFGMNFRNEGVDHTHQPSFGAFECYKANSDFFEMMELTETLIRASVKALHGNEYLRFKGEHYDFSGSWPRLSMVHLVARELGVMQSNLTEDVMIDAWQSRLPDMPLPNGWGLLVAGLFEKLIEGTLRGPVFVIDHPVEISPLTKVSPDDPRVTERFELYLNGVELANAYSELNDPVEQQARLLSQDLSRDETYGFDAWFLVAMQDGCPQAGGLGIGMDRLAMILLGAERINEVIAFPLA